tara:strand:- start:2610 stop:2828 length:219 start_codon:yes stop_codon:yes gene_type:complete
MTQQIKAVLTQSNNLRAKTVAIGAAQSLLDLTDIDAALIDDGAILIYESSTQKFSVRPSVNNANTKIIGGNY